MASTVTITKRKELVVFVRRHLDHRLTALVAPLVDDVKIYSEKARGDLSKSAQEGCYVMLRKFIEFLGVKGQYDSSTRKYSLEERAKLPKKSPGTDVQKSDLVLSCFASQKGKKLQDLKPHDFGRNGAFVAKIHRTLCKINAHFTYDTTRRRFRDRISGIPRKELEKAVKIIVRKLDKHFYQKVGHDIVVHADLVGPFKKRFAGLIKSDVTCN